MAAIRKKARGIGEVLSRQWLEVRFLFSYRCKKCDEVVKVNGPTGMLPLIEHTLAHRTEKASAASA